MRPAVNLEVLKGIGKGTTKNQNLFWFLARLWKDHVMKTACESFVDDSCIAAVFFFKEENF